MNDTSTPATPSPETPIVSDVNATLDTAQRAALMAAMARQWRMGRSRNHHTKGAFGNSHFLNRRHVEYKGGMAKPIKEGESTSTIPNSNVAEPKTLDIAPPDGVGLEVASETSPTSP